MRRLLALGSLFAVCVACSPAMREARPPATLVGEHGLSWPVACTPGATCTSLGLPDVNGDGKAFDCTDSNYAGHEGVDIATKTGTAVYAAAAGEVLWVFDGKYDACPDLDEEDCAEPKRKLQPGSTEGYLACTPLGPYCRDGRGSCFWCFAGGNVAVIRHRGTPGVFATRYDHLRRGSISVRPGDEVERGQKIAEVASAGRSTAPHLHFEVWGATYYSPVDPWSGECSTPTRPSLWRDTPPWGSR